MVNVYTCFRGNKTTTKYRLDPPSMEEYLNVRDQDRYDGHDTSEYMLNFLNGNNP